MIALYQFLNGFSSMGAAACGLFFLKFWSKSRDRLFLIFAFSFWIMALERLLLVFHEPTVRMVEETAPIYFLRLLAFVMILYAFWDKNRRR
ncbi:MAG: DUF5985 family protein [Bdellovibrionota bacterium]